MTTLPTDRSASRELREQVEAAASVAPTLAVASGEAKNAALRATARLLREAQR